MESKTAHSTFANDSQRRVDARAELLRLEGKPVLNVVVASEVKLFQDGIAALLDHANCVRIVGTASLPQVLAKVAQLHPDIVLFDATRPSNLEYARALANRTPAPKVVAFGVSETATELLALAAAGVAGYVGNDAAPDDVVRIVLGAMRGELVCSPRAAATIYQHLALLSRDTCSESSSSSLSEREMQIAMLIDRGLSNKEIARTLGIQATTVKNHVHNILDKLNVRRRGEAAARLRAVLRRRGADRPGLPSRNGVS